MVIKMFKLYHLHEYTAGTKNYIHSTENLLVYKSWVVEHHPSIRILNTELKTK